MPNLGIIAEFNPFHNGHLHLISEAKKYNDFNATICVMSGNFLQRGEAALCNKWARAQMALLAGADLVIEIPFCFAVRSAYFFARGSIELLYRTGVVSHLAFGSESGNLNELRSISSIIAHESKEYQTNLRYYLAQGISFAAARSKTLQATIGQKFPTLENTLMQPNNILALEYLRVLEQESIPIEPLTIPRKGPGYHSAQLSSYASASAIRKSLLSNDHIDNVSEFMPASSLKIILQELSSGRAPLQLSAMEQSILLKLRTTPVEELHNIYEISEGLENRIQQASISCGTLEDLKQYIKSKRYSLTRINRILLYSLLGINCHKIQEFDNVGPLYSHILGFSTQGQKILQQMKNNSNLRILSRGTDVKHAHQDRTQPVLSSMIDLDVKATDIFSLFYPNIEARKGGQDFTTSPVRI